MKRNRFLVRESLRNVWSYAFIAFALVVMSTLGGFVVTLSTAEDVSNIEDEYKSSQDQGTEILLVRAERPFDSLKCERLREIEGINDAGARLSRNNATLEDLPGASLIVSRVTPGFARLGWNIPEAPRSLGVGSEVSRNLGLRLGQEIRIVSRSGERNIVSGTVDTALPPTLRLQEANQEVVIIDLPVGSTNECIVEPEKGATSAVEKLLMSTFNDASVSPLARDALNSSALNDRLQNRITLWVPIIVGVTILLLSLMTTFARRADWALLQILGARRRDVIVMIYVEFLCVTLLPFIIGSTVGLLFAAWLYQIGKVTEISIIGDLARLGATLVIGPIITCILVSSRPTNRLKGQ